MQIGLFSSGRIMPQALGLAHAFLGLLAVSSMSIGLLCYLRYNLSMIRSLEVINIQPYGLLYLSVLKLPTFIQGIYKVNQGKIGICERIFIEDCQVIARPTGIVGYLVVGYNAPRTQKFLKRR